MNYQAFSVMEYRYPVLVQFPTAYNNDRLGRHPGTLARHPIIAYIEQTYGQSSAYFRAIELFEPNQVNIGEHGFNISYYLIIEWLIRHIEIVKSALTVSIIQ